MADRYRVGMLLMHRGTPEGLESLQRLALFLEHPDLPEQWRPKSGGPSGSTS
jgi:hypothetical protein